MTQAKASPPRDDEDAAISAAVYALLADRGETVADLAYHTRISIASLYRKLGGQAGWKAADVGAVARHYGLLPGDLFRGVEARRVRPTRPAASGPTGEYSDSRRLAA